MAYLDRDFDPPFCEFRMSEFTSAFPVIVPFKYEYVSFLFLLNFFHCSRGQEQGVLNMPLLIVVCICCNDGTEIVCISVWVVHFIKIINRQQFVEIF